jgi:hypothetical protein
MPGLNLNMGAFGAGGAGSYAGPVYGSDGGAASVPYSTGYGDTGAGSALTFGPGSVTGPGGSNPTAHALAFGVFCFAALIFLGWALPR